MPCLRAETRLTERNIFLNDIFLQFLKNVAVD